MRAINNWRIYQLTIIFSKLFISLIYLDVRKILPTVNAMFFKGFFVTKKE